jgi:hypothetical protein
MVGVVAGTIERQIDASAQIVEEAPISIVLEILCPLLHWIHLVVLCTAGKGSWNSTGSERVTTDSRY